MLSLAILTCHAIVIHYSCVSRDRIIAASAFEKSRFSYRDIMEYGINRSAIF